MTNVVSHRIPELVIKGKRLGRHFHHDLRSAAYPAELAPAIVSVRHASSGLPLDQGQVGSCTANALVGCLNSVPHWKAGQPTLGEQDALKAYSLEEQLLGYGPYPPSDEGGNGTTVCKAGQQLGWLDGYQHAVGLDAALRALVIRPVIVGVNWYTSFDNPSTIPQGYGCFVTITPGATVRGGHEIVATEIDAPHELVWFWNSWGLGYGFSGRFCMKFATLGRLLDEGGDVTVPRTAHGWQA